MRLFALPAIVLAFSGGASAMKIPLGLAEGVYIASIDESGNQNFTRLPDAPVAPRFDALVHVRTAFETYTDFVHITLGSHQTISTSPIENSTTSAFRLEAQRYRTYIKSLLSKTVLYRTCARMLATIAIRQSGWMRCSGRGTLVPAKTVINGWRRAGSRLEAGRRYARCRWQSYEVWF
jgi:hypothetical protein